MDSEKVMPAFLRSRKKHTPKGVISINRKKPRIEKYDDSPTVFSTNFVAIDNDQPIEMPPTEE